MIFKILREDEYMSLIIDGEFKGSKDDKRSGFIHMSTKEQLAGTLAKHFADEPLLHLLAIDASGLEDLKWEVSRGGAEFPHLYATLSSNDIAEHWEVEDHRLPRDI